MATPENSRHATGEPVHSGQIVEDLLHGPSVEALRKIPYMPRGDGTYYQAGMFYTVGTTHFDVADRPVYRTTSASGILDVMQEMRDLEEWRETSLAGEDALTALEARRQLARLERNGVAHAFKPSDVCGGGKRVDACETATSMIRAAQKLADSVEKPRVSDEDSAWNRLDWLGRSCGACSLSCEVAYETRDSEPTGIARFTNVLPGSVTED